MRRAGGAFFGGELAFVLAVAIGAIAQQTTAVPQQLGRSDSSFSEPSLAPGVDYTVPTEAEIKATLDRILNHFVRSTPYRIIDSSTGKPITDFSHSVKTAEIDLSSGEFNDWTYSTGVALAGMLHVADVTGDRRYQDYALKNFDFIFDHLNYFRRQAQQFGLQPHGYRRLLAMHELDDCGAIGFALVKAYAQGRAACEWRGFLTFGAGSRRTWGAASPTSCSSMRRRAAAAVPHVGQLTIRSRSVCAKDSGTFLLRYKNNCAPSHQGRPGPRVVLFLLWHL